MCGIIGAIAGRSITKTLINGLKKLEYRGYDSAGIALLNTEGDLQRLRVMGKVNALEEAICTAPPLEAHTGIAHTRWATHGAPSEKNAHPFISGKFILVHNGIIENHMHLRKKLLKSGYEFSSETDTETAVHLIHDHFMRSQNWIIAIQNAIKEFEGAYALGILFRDDPKHLVGVRQGAPLVVGHHQNEQFIASDPLALISIAQQFTYLEDGDLALLSQHQIKIYDKQGNLSKRNAITLPVQQYIADRGQYRHYMKKEIMEQPIAINHCLKAYFNETSLLSDFHEQFLPLIQSLSSLEHIQFVACGTSYHAALIARYWIENYAHISCSVEIASEFRYHTIPPQKKSLFIVLSQSGETADTLSCLRLAKKNGYLASLAICNVANSSMTREADMHLLTYAGIEIGVASTKAFTAQLIVLCLLTLYLHEQKKLSLFNAKTLIQALHDLPALVSQSLEQDHIMLEWARTLMNQEYILFLGRGTLYPIALEGALKMKELSYIHAEGYPAGELKHGPLALVEQDTPVIALATSGPLLEKTLSNLQEVRARGGALYLLSDNETIQQQPAFSSIKHLLLATTHPLLVPIIHIIPLQLLAYHVAVAKGTDVDQPRNLAKSVTVE